jgi:hypothetical protein
MNQITLSDIRPGMIAFSCGSSFISKAIAYFTRRAPQELVPSHSFPIHEGPGGILCAIETTATKVHVAPLIRKLDEHDWIEVYEPVCEEQKIRYAAAQSFLIFPDQTYGYLSYLWFMWRWLLRKFGVEPVRMWKWVDGGITCTELTCGDLILRGDQFVGLLGSKDLNALAPQDLKDIINQKPDLFRQVGWLKLPT